MEKQHLTYFKIENFKRFDSFEMSNLGQFNLIVGDNNVGKTSVLEGLLFDEDLGILMLNYLGAISMRKVFDFKYGELINNQQVKNTNFWSYIFRDITKSIEVSLSERSDNHFSLTFSAFEKLPKGVREEIVRSMIVNYTHDWISLSSDVGNKLSAMGAYFETIPSNIRQKASMPFIAENLGYGQDLVDKFYQYINSNKELRKDIESYIRNFIPTLEETRIHRFGLDSETLCVTLVDDNNIVPITRYGEGTVKFIRFLIEVILAQGKRLMVDEISAGIHFTRLTSYWKTIIQLCDKYKVQLFATTHSLECQQAFIEALEDPEMQQYQKDARNISLIENKKGEVEAITFDFEQFEYALNIGFNTRGGKR